MEKIIFGTHQLDHPLINAAGTCKTLDDVKEFAKSAVLVITVGSATFLPNPGNPGNVLYYTEYSSINSIGLTNPGKDYYQQNLPEMVAIAHNAGKLLIFSIAANTPEEFEIIAMMALELGVDFVEWNGGCPNKWHDGKQGQILCFDFDLMQMHLGKYPEDVQKRIGIKVSPYSDPMMRVRLVHEFLVNYSFAYLASTNTYPNSFAFQPSGQPAIDSKNVPLGLGGQAGHAIKDNVLGQNLQFRTEMDKHENLRQMPIIGIGGVYTGRDVLEHKRCGATLVGVASAYMEHGNMRVFGWILSEYVREVHKQ